MQMEVPLFCFSEKDVSEALSRHQDGASSQQQSEVSCDVHNYEVIMTALMHTAGANLVQALGSCHGKWNLPL